MGLKAVMGVMDAAMARPRDMSLRSMLAIASPFKGRMRIAAGVEEESSFICSRVLSGYGPDILVGLGALVAGEGGSGVFSRRGQDLVVRLAILLLRSKRHVPDPVLAAHLVVIHGSHSDSALTS